MVNKNEIFKDIVINLKNQNTRDAINEISNNMQKNYNVPSGVTQSFLVREKEDSFFEKTDSRLIGLFIYESLKAMSQEKFIDKYFTKGELNEIKQFDYKAYFYQDKITLPYDFQPAIPVNNVFSTKISVKQISEFVNAGIINYNFDIQREAKLEIRTNSIIKIPTLNKNNIREMEQLLLDENLKESTLYFNAAPMTSDTGDELFYDPKSFTLTITEGTRIDVIDGFHRVLAAQNAYRANPMIDFEFNVVFSNFTTSEAIKWQAQHSKATSWSKNRIAELQQDSKGAKVIKAIKDKDVEFDKLIYSGKRIKRSESIIAFRELAKAIDNLFDIVTRRDEVKVADEVAEIILSFNDLKQVNRTMMSQWYFLVALQYYAESKMDISSFINLLNKIYDYMKNNEVDLSIRTTSTKQMKEVAMENFKNLIERVEE